MRKLSTDELRYMNLFRTITHVPPLDCFMVSSQLIFITEKGLAARAIGKQGKNIKLLREKLKKDIKVVEKAESPLELVRNYLFPLKADINFDAENSSIINIQFRVRRERRFLLDNQQRELKDLHAVVKRYFPEIKEIRVL